MASKQPKKTTNSVSSKVLDLVAKKLESSGLTLEDGKQLGMIPLDPTGTANCHPIFSALCSLKIPYFDPFGKPLSDSPKANPYYRIRYLEKPTDFSASTDKKEVRYVQEPTTLPVAYYPKNQTWDHILGDADCPIVITEGELKAAKCCKEGFPAIGLGGVFSWKSVKSGIEWLPSLEYVNWVRRSVYIVFDSDYQTNENVCIALGQLAKKLHDEGAYVYVVTLPNLEGFDKIGLDDFLTFAGINSNQLFEELMTVADPLGLTNVLWGFNDRYVYVRDPGMIMDQTTNSKTNPGAFKEHLECAAKYQARQIGSEGRVSHKPVSAASAWIEWPLRIEVSKITYKPGKEKFVKDTNEGHNKSMFNIWPGWGIKPRKGDVKLFLKLVDHIFTGVEKEARQWFLSWCAYPLQNPGTKLFSSAVLHGIRHGTGKSLIGYTLGRIYGKNFTEISQMDLHNSFNEWAEGKQFVMGDDVTGSNKRQDADFLKKLITQRELRVNGKYVPTYVVPDCINYFFTANHPDSFFLEDDDRRFFIVEVQVGPMDEEFYVEYNLWLDSGGAEAVFNYLLNFDIGSFNPAAPAFKTTAKERMIANVQSDLAGWVRQLIATPSHVLRIGQIEVKKDLFTSKELLSFYDPDGHTGTTANGLGRELARAGVRQVYQGKPIRLGDGSQARYYAIRNQEQWLATSTLSLIVKYLDDCNKKGKH